MASTQHPFTQPLLPVPTSPPRDRGSTSAIGATTERALPLSSLLSRGVPTEIAMELLVCKDRRLARTIALVMEDLTRRPSRATAARTANLEAGYFSRRFRKVVGMSFTEWNARIRMEAAKRMLESAEVAVTQVAAAVGYSDLTTFERNFRRYVGSCPRSFRYRVTASTRNGRT
jgi:AraC-like DNA-binding protein